MKEETKKRMLYAFEMGFWAMVTVVGAITTTIFVAWLGYLTNSILQFVLPLGVGTFWIVAIVAWVLYYPELSQLEEDK